MLQRRQDWSCVTAKLFAVDLPQEESSNQAHYRGRCLDGIEGRGRTLLLRDTRLRD